METGNPTPAAGGRFEGPGLPPTAPFEPGLGQGDTAAPGGSDSGGPSLTATPGPAWWRLEMTLAAELEESLLWKLPELGIPRVAVR
ncbi:MAG: hypothetical protein WCP63_08615, partial [Cyanobium sp. ELA712]